jgi:DNA-binding response OmpR family regulator
MLRQGLFMDHGEFSILITDRNRHVREFLRRELTAEGYNVRVARDGREVLMVIDQEAPSPDLLILDLEVPYAGGLALLERLQSRENPVPVVVHTFLAEDSSHMNSQYAAVFVEKSGNTDKLKTAIAEVLSKCYPQRFTLSRTKCLREEVDDR